VKEGYGSRLSESRVVPWVKEDLIGSVRIDGWGDEKRDSWVSKINSLEGSVHTPGF
jgi:hypothetical protein